MTDLTDKDLHCTTNVELLIIIQKAMQNKALVSTIVLKVITIIMLCIIGSNYLFLFSLLLFSNQSDQLAAMKGKCSSCIQNQSKPPYMVN